MRVNPQTAKSLWRQLALSGVSTNYASWRVREGF